jgi:hypothetical protein
MDRDSPPPTKPANKRSRTGPVPGVPDGKLPRANVEIRIPREDLSSYPPPRTDVEIADDDEAAVQSMRAPRGRAAKTIAIVGAGVATFAGLVPVLSATLESCQKRQEAEAREADQRAKVIPELTAKLEALELAIKNLQTVDPKDFERHKKDLDDARARLTQAERDITKLYRARPSRQPDD